jgi:hypothetical protein
MMGVFDGSFLEAIRPSFKFAESKGKMVGGHRIELWTACW